MVYQVVDIILSGMYRSLYCHSQEDAQTFCFRENTLSTIIGMENDSQHTEDRS